MYLTELRGTRGNAPIHRQPHRDADAAAFAFASMVQHTELDGQPLLAALLHKEKVVARHRFNGQPNGPDDWRHRLEEIPWPRLGGERSRSGVKIEGRSSSVTLDAASDALARSFGNGDRALGVRRALAIADRAVAMLKQAGLTDS